MLCHICINVYHGVLYNLYNADGFVAKNDNDNMVIQFASINVSSVIRRRGAVSIWQGGPKMALPAGGWIVFRRAAGRPCPLFLFFQLG